MYMDCMVCQVDIQVFDSPLEKKAAHKRTVTVLCLGNVMHFVLLKGNISNISKDRRVCSIYSFFG